VCVGMFMVQWYRVGKEHWGTGGKTVFWTKDGEFFSAWYQTNIGSFITC
jgi:hypothetical protein